MSFVPLGGAATFTAAEPPRAGTVEFTDGGRSVSLPVRAALPVLTKAQARDDAHPSVALLAAAAHLALRLVAAGKLEPGEGAWVAALDEDDEERVRLLAQARAYDGLPTEAAEKLVHDVLHAVADALPSSAPLAAVPGRDRGRGSQRRPDPLRPPGRSFTDRIAARLAEHRDRGTAEEPAQLVRLSVRVEADEEELVAGSVRLVLQVHDERNPLRIVDAAVLFTDPEEALARGFGGRARTHAAIALRGAAEAWPVLDRMVELRVPDEITLDADEIVSLLAEGVAALRTRGIDVLWPRSLGRDLLSSSAELDASAGDRRQRRGPAEPREEPLQEPALAQDQLFSFRWRLALGDDPLTEEEMAELARAASPLIKLRGTWVVVDPATARKARKRLIRSVGPGEAVAAALTGTLRVESPEGEVDEQVVVGASLLAVRDRIVGAAAKEPLEPPPGLAATLRPYQRQGLTWLAELTGAGLGACLADDMGLGKTITLIALHLHRRTRGVAAADAPTLVVCPASLLGNWEAEIQRFAPGVPVRRFHGGARSLDGLDGGFVLTTYGTVRTSAQELSAVGWDLVVADEAQHIKNPRSQIARVLRTLPSAARVALTGTPVENNLTELWAILDWATPGLLGSRNAFRKAWAMHIEAGEDPARTRQFAQLIGPFLLRRRKSDPQIAPELPEKTETDHLLSLTREQAVLYEAFVRDMMERIERSDEQTRRGMVLKLLTGCKQICNHPAQFLKESGAGRLTGRSEKLELLDELVETVLAEGGGVLVFTQYVAMARLVEAHLTRRGYAHQFLHGGTPVREREAMVRRFQEVPDGEPAPVFLLSLKAGGTGLNLTRADHVIHLDRWWNPAVESQATDRAYRIGQTRPVQVHRMVTRGTVEERIAELLDRKRALADAVLAGGEAALTELSDDDLRDLVELR